MKLLLKKGRHVCEQFETLSRISQLTGPVELKMERREVRFATWTQRRTQDLRQVARYPRHFPHHRPLLCPSILRFQEGVQVPAERLSKDDIVKSKGNDQH
jgi:hypothetical protein